MLVKHLEVPHYKETKLFVDNPSLFNKLKDYYTLQADMYHQRKLRTLFEKHMDVAIKIRDTEVTKIASYIDAQFDRADKITYLYLNLNKLESSKSASHYINFLFAKVTFAIILNEYARKKVILDDNMRRVLCNILYSFFYREIGIKGKIINKKQDEIAIFEILVRKYIYDVILSPIKPTPWNIIRNSLVTFDPVIFVNLSKQFSKAFNDIKDLNKAFTQVGLLEEDMRIEYDILQKSIFMEKTLFYIERLEYLVPFIYVINFDTKGAFDDNFKRYNKDQVYKFKDLFYSAMLVD